MQGELFAQPQARRNQQQQQQKAASGANALTNRAKIMFPTAQTMDADVVWRRDVYREIDLNDDANAGLYYPIAPQGTQMNLFTYMFKLMMAGQIKAYEYRLDGNELYTDSARVKPMRFLKDYEIYYEKGANGKIRIDNSDIPSAQVKRYYVKESSYYDQKSATFHTQVLALCPILERDDEDWGDDIKTNYPLFWVKFEDLAPFLSKQTVMTSNLNNAATMSMDDFFNKTMYKGKIYKTVNMQGKLIKDYCKTDSAVAKEQKRIEDEIIAFEKSMWGDQARKDSLDSIAKLSDADKKAAKKASKKNRRAGGNTTEVKASKPAKQKASSSSSGSGKVTVRRQRH